MHSLKADQILIIDDLWQVLETAANAGFQAASSIECITYMDEHK